MENTTYTYSDGHDTFIGRLIYDPSLGAQQPGVLIAPAYAGLGEDEIAIGEKIAALGYTVLAVDYYGDGKRAQSDEQAMEWMGFVNTNRDVFARRMIAALDALKSIDRVTGPVGAMGYCLGGKAVLDLARTGADLTAIAALHGVFDAPDTINTYKAAALILHGWDDPLATPDNFVALTQELTENCPDWHAECYGHASHSFTNPNAQLPEMGIVYNKLAADRSWAALTRFFDEKLIAA
ncbi:MAG: dienelactone hydrolase family protein [Thalassovita sp.]